MRVVVDEDLPGWLPLIEEAAARWPGMACPPTCFDVVAGPLADQEEGRQAIVFTVTDDYEIRGDWGDSTAGRPIDDPDKCGLGLLITKVRPEEPEETSLMVYPTLRSRLDAAFATSLGVFACGPYPGCDSRTCEWSRWWESLGPGPDDEAALCRAWRHACG